MAGGRYTRARQQLSRTRIVGLVGAGVALLALGLVMLPRILQPQTGTLLVIVAGRSADSLPSSSVDIHRVGGWVTLGTAVGAVPAAPDERQVLAIPLAVGSYDAIRIGNDSVSVNVQVVKGEVEPVLVGIAHGRVITGAAYAGNDEVNLGLGELSGRYVPIPAFSLVDQNGRPFDNDTTAGKDLVVAAFHTSCRETCPLYTALFLQLQKKIPAGVQLAEVTTDPGTDTPSTLAAYSSRVGAHWTFATGLEDEVARFWQPFGVELATGDTHTSTLALIDKHGYIRLVYRGVPDVGGVAPPGLTADMSPAGLHELSTHGDGWGAPDVLAALLTVAQAETMPAANGHVPDFDLTGTDGSHVRLADLAGQPFVLNFWATFCPPCRTEMPMLTRVVPGEPGVRLLLVNEGDSPAAVRDFLSSIGVAAPALLDSDLSVGRAYGVIGFPTTVFVRADGTVEGRYVGAIDQRVLAAHLANLIGQ